MISDIGHAWLSMPFLNGRMMFRTAREEMHVWKERQYRCCRLCESTKTYLNSTDLVFDEINEEPISNFSTSLLDPLQQRCFRRLERR